MPETKIKKRTIQVREFPVFSMESLKWLLAIGTILVGALVFLWKWQNIQDEERKAVSKVAEHNKTILTEHVKQSDKTFQQIADVMQVQITASNGVTNAVSGVQLELRHAKENRDRIERDVDKLCDDMEKHSHPTP